MSIAKPSRMSSWIALAFVVLGLVGGIWIGQAVEPAVIVQGTQIEVLEDAQGLYTVQRGKRVAVEAVLSPADAEALPEAERDGLIVRDANGEYEQLTATSHLGFWSLLPAVVAIGLCLLIREPLVSLLMGILTGGLMLGAHDVTGEVILPVLASTGAAKVLLLYLVLLGALMGIWSCTGAARAFADWATYRLVRGPRTAKLVAWGLGVLFFQGGTVSTVLVGTSVKPIADKEKVSHEELSYIVDSTASPIAILLAFNAWPAYVQGLIYVPGVVVLATESDRLSFFFQSLPLSFYAWFAVLGTLLLALGQTWMVGPGMKRAIRRARETGELDRPGAEPLLSPELHEDRVVEGYRPWVWEFAAPLVLLTAVAIGTFIGMGSPEVMWAFSAAVVLSGGMALARGMSVAALMGGVATGFKGVVGAAVILLAAVTLGSVMKQIGGGAYLVAALAESFPYWAMPSALMVLTMVIAFATGTSWGTFAVAFPLAMPLAWALSQSARDGAGLDRPVLYLMVCFAAVLNGSVYGDQCSPISDTTVLSSLTTGADLIDHVKTQLVPASAAAVMAMLCWQVVVWGWC